MTSADRAALDALYSGVGSPSTPAAGAGRSWPTWWPWLIAALAALLGYLGGRFHEACEHVHGEE